uniref:interleukin-10 receptor subunit alpha n=1 Tax=Semicossyphus pulcher TaxID=241346 RepID=UPI0037E83B9B
MTPVNITEMDVNKTLNLVLLMICIHCVSGLDIPKPDKLMVDIMDGEVIAFWNNPANLPPNYKYNVQMAKYIGAWETVESCTAILRTSCDLSSRIHDYSAAYKVRVQLVAGVDVSEWTVKLKFLPNTSKLSPPSFTWLATSSTQRLCVYQKPILRKLFPYGVVYTIYLEETGEENKTTIAYLKDNVDEYQRCTTFTTLHWGREYCVSIKVEGSGALMTSPESHKQCLLLPEQEYFIIAVSSLSIMGVLSFVAIMVALLICYLRRPEKTPAALKSPVSGWRPLSVGEGTMEVVTDKGWFLSGYRPEIKNCVKGPETHVTVTEDNEEEERRTSMDSGLSMEAVSTTNSEGNPPLRQEDSGFGSLGGSESSTSGQTDYPLKEERTNVDIERRREDSGVGLGCQLDSSSMNLDGQDSGSLKEVLGSGGYRHQSPSSVHIQVCDDKEMFEQMLPKSLLAEVVTGYRAGPQSCICSGAGQCSWCHHQSQYGGEIVKQYRSLCIENGLLSSKCDFVDSYKKTFSSYSKETQLDTLVIEDLEPSFIQLKETFPLLTALAPLPLVEAGQDFNMNNVPLALCDVQLITD